MPCEYSFIIFYASLRSLTSTKPSTEVLPMLKAFSEVDFIEDPLQNLLTRSKDSILLLRMEVEKGLQMSGSTAITLVLGLICFITLAIALTSPPPPAGTST